MDQAGELLLQLFHVGAQGLDVIDLDLTLLLVDVNKLELSAVLLVLRKATSCSLIMSLVTLPNSAYSPIL